MSLRITDVVEKTIAGLHKVDMPVPSDEDAERLLRAVLTGNDEVRDTVKRHQWVRFLQQSRKNATEDERVFLSLLKFHRGGGQLDGYMMARFRIPDEDEFERLDTLAMVMIVANGGRCRAAERWAEVLGR